MYTGKKSVSDRTAGCQRDVRTMQFCWLFVFLLFLCYLAVHVKCTVYHFSDCNRQGYCSFESLLAVTEALDLWARLQRAASVGGTKTVIVQKDCHWSALTSQRLNIMSGWDVRPAAQCSRLNSDIMKPQAPLSPPHGHGKKIYRFIYIYIHIYVCICTYINNWWRSWW